MISPGHGRRASFRQFGLPTKAEMMSEDRPILDTCSGDDRGLGESYELERPGTDDRPGRCIGSNRRWPASYLLNLEAASDAGLTLEDAQGVLVAIAPIVGTARTVSAATAITEALGLALTIEAPSRRAKREPDRRHSLAASPRRLRRRPRTAGRSAYPVGRQPRAVSSVSVPIGSADVTGGTRVPVATPTEVVPPGIGVSSGASRIRAGAPYPIRGAVRCRGQWLPDGRAVVVGAGPGNTHCSPFTGPWPSPWSSAAG